MQGNGHTSLVSLNFDDSNPKDSLELKRTHRVAAQLALFFLYYAVLIADEAVIHKRFNIPGGSQSIRLVAIELKYLEEFIFQEY